jgi:ribosomal protein L11 methyltransferase
VSAHFVVSLSVPDPVRTVGLEPVSELSREEFFGWLWGAFGERGLVGVHEGTCLAGDSEVAPEWTLDVAQAPSSRDWVAEQSILEQVQLYFTSQAEAEVAIQLLKEWPSLGIQGIHEQLDQDWDADWKASFLNAGEGVVVPPYWRILPPWSRPSDLQEKPLWINPGAGFGTGTHETTQLCLQALSEVAPRFPKAPFALDFGSGSGILAIALARLGYSVQAVEVDTMAIENAQENAALNQVESRIQFHTALPVEPPSGYSILVANILKPTLLEFAPQLIERVAPDGVLLLSGLLESDVSEVVEAYLRVASTSSRTDLRPLVCTQVAPLGEWRLVRFERA